MLACPSCGGEHRAAHPCGLLVFNHTLSCGLRDAEDATVHADAERLATGVLPAGAEWVGGSGSPWDRRPAAFRRAATAVERELLAVHGITLGDDDTTTVQPGPSPLVRRSWPEHGAE